MSAMPRGLTSFGGVALGGAYYVVGGYSGEPHNYSVEGQSKDVWRLSLEGADAGNWSKVAVIPYGLQGLAVVAHGDEICRFGGNRVMNVQGQKADMMSVVDAACLHTKTGAWRELPSLPKGRSSFDAVTVGHNVYLVGGWQLGDGQRGGDEQSGAWATDVLQLDLSAASPRWASVSAPLQTRAAGVVSAGGKVYLMGGLTADKSTSRAVHIYDPASAKWTVGPELPSDGFGMAAIDRGERVVVSTRDGAIFELEGKAWKPQGQLTFPRFFHRLAWRGQELLAIGGISGMQTHGRTRVVEVFAFDRKEASVSQVDVAFPGAAKNRQAVFVRGDFLYMFGGNNSLEQHDFEPANFVDEGHRLHLPSLTWKAVAAFPQKRQSMQIADIGDQALAIGGFGHNGQAAVSFREAYLFDPSRETWAPTTGLPAGRTQFGLTSYQGEIFVFGGLNYDPARDKSAFDHVRTNLVMPKGGAFQELAAPLPGPRRAFGGVTVGDEYFVVGGMREDFKLVEDCLRYSFKTKKYTAMPCPPKTRLSARLVALDGKVYAVAGNTRGPSGQLEPDRSVDVFDPKTNRWSTLISDVGFDTHHANVALYRDSIVMASTQNKSGLLRVVFIRPAR
jgi:N-acetylneuraminic acid mutarotase